MGWPEVIDLEECGYCGVWHLAEPLCPDLRKKVGDVLAKQDGYVFPTDVS